MMAIATSRATMDAAAGVDITEHCGIDCSLDSTPTVSAVGRRARGRLLGGGRAHRLQLSTGMCRQSKRFTGAVLVCVAVVCFSPAHTAAQATSAAAAPSKVAADVITLTNAERTQFRRAALRANPRLMRAAQLQADQMARARRMAHELPGARYPRTLDRIAAADYRWYSVGENVAFGQPNAAKVLDSWMHSRGHRTNILNATFTEMGAGYAIDRTGRPYYVQVFGRPLS